MGGRTNACSGYALFQMVLIVRQLRLLPHPRDAEDHLPRWPLVYRVVFEACKISTLGANAERSGLNEGGRLLMGLAPELQG
jgi:hypothetical protein